MYQSMWDQDGTDLQRFHLLKNSMIIQQICGALVAFSLSFCNMYSKIMKLSIQISSKKDTYSKVAHAFLCHRVLQKKVKKAEKNKMLSEALIK